MASDPPPPPSPSVLGSPDPASPPVPAQVLTTHELADPPPPYPSARRPRRARRRDGQPSTVSAEDVDFPGDAETSPLLGPRRPGHGRTRTMSGTSLAPSLARSVASLFTDACDGADDPAAPAPAAPAAPDTAGRWRRYWRPVARGAYWRALAHLALVNFPFALLAWVYLFVFTVTGTALLITLPLGAVLCFFNLLGARAFARGELALQSRFHGPLAVEPYPPHPIFTRPRIGASDSEAGPSVPASEPSFYKNTYAMFADATTYRALFYFLVIKPGITLLLWLLALVGAPVCAALILPLPALLRLARRLGAWQAGVAVEGLYLLS